MWWQNGERESTLVTSLCCFSISLPYPEALVVWPVSGGQAAAAANCSAEIVCLSVTVPTPPANQKLQHHLQLSPTYTLTYHTRRAVFAYMRVVCHRLCHN